VEARKGRRTHAVPERIADMAEKEQFILTVCANGYGKLSSAYGYRRTGRGGQGITNIDNIERNGPVVASFPATKGDQLMLVTDQAKLIRMPLDSCACWGRGTAGVRLFNVDDNEHVVGAAKIEESDEGEDFETTTPLEEAATGSGHGEAVLRAYRATNLLYPIEKTRMQGLLRGSDGDNFIRAAARFALGEGKSALRAMETLLRPHDNAKWTVVSYLPYLWRPDSHIFLKPEVTKDFAARVSHPLASSYVSDLDYGVYEDLLDMAGVIRQSVIDLEPRDMIDIQSVIWVVGDYREGREIPQP
jgi:hypothetical protein